jgi:hypothetical protein
VCVFACVCVCVGGTVIRHTCMQACINSYTQLITIHAHMKSIKILCSCGANKTCMHIHTCIHTYTHSSSPYTPQSSQDQVNSPPTQNSVAQTSCTYMHIHAHTYTHAHTHIHTHTHTRSSSPYTPKSSQDKVNSILTQASVSQTKDAHKHTHTHTHTLTHTQLIPVHTQIKSRQSQQSLDADFCCCSCCKTEQFGCKVVSSIPLLCNIIYIYIYIHFQHTCIRIYIHTHIYIHRSPQPRAKGLMCSCRNIFHKHININVYIHTYIHTHVATDVCERPRVQL